MSTLTPEHEKMLQRMSEAATSDDSYEKMLKSLPDSVKRSFIELSKDDILNYSRRNIRKKLEKNPGMARLLKEHEIQLIIDQVYSNILEDQYKVKTMLDAEAKNSGQKPTHSERVVYR